MTSEPKIKQDPESWEKGYRAGLSGERGVNLRSLVGIDGLSYFSGLIEGNADRLKPPEQRRPAAWPQEKPPS